jgi:hypothetical protein
VVRIGWLMAALPIGEICGDAIFHVQGEVGVSLSNKIILSVVERLCSGQIEFS